MYIKCSKIESGYYYYFNVYYLKLNNLAHIAHHTPAEYNLITGIFYPNC